MGNSLHCAVRQGKVASWIPGIVFSSLAIVTGVLVLLLPETLNRPLPETIKDVENLTRSLTPSPSSPQHAAADDTGLSPIREADSDEKDDTKKMWL